MRHATRLLLSTAAMLSAAPAFAQEAPAPDEQPQNENSIVVVAQRANQSQVERGGSVGVLGEQAGEDVPFSIRSYNAALILNQQPQTLGQLLDNDPSVRTTYGFGNAAELFVIRGFALASDDVGLEGLYGIAPRQLVAPELYEQVQVLNGASAFLNGAAPGGTGIGGNVNLIFKSAGPADLQRFTLNYTSDAHLGGSFDVARRFGDVGLRVNGAFRSGDVSVEDEFRRTGVLGASFDWESGAFRLSVDAAYQNIRVEQLRPKVTLATTTIPEVPRADANYAQPFTFTALEDVFGVVRAEYDLSEDVLIYATFGARDGSEDGIYGGITVNDAATGAATGSALLVPARTNNEALHAGVRASFSAGGITHQFNAGGSLVRSVFRTAYDFLGGFGGFATNLYNPVPVPLPGTGFVGGDLDDPFPITRTRLSSLFVSDTLGFLDDRVLLTAGLRLQSIRQLNYSYADGALVSEYDEQALSPVVGLVVKPAEGLSLFANRIQGLAQGPTAPVDPILVNPGEVFAPFESTQYEVGAKFSRDRFNASIALFTTDQPSAFSIPEGAQQRFGVFGTQRNRGIEFSVDGEPARGLRIIAGLSVIDARFRETAGGLNEDNQAPGVPDYLANANVEWDLPFLPALTVTGRVLHSGPQPVNAANTLELPDWTRFDLGLRYVALVAERPVTLRVNVDNVANERYWASAFDSFSPQLLQGAPRTYKLSVSFEL